VVNDVGVDGRLLLTTWRPQRLVDVAAVVVVMMLDDHHLGILRHLCCVANVPLQHTPRQLYTADFAAARCCPLVGQFKYRVHLFEYSSLVIIPAKAFARDYGITGVRLSVCLSVCLLPR